MPRCQSRWVFYNKLDKLFRVLTAQCPVSEGFSSLKNKKACCMAKTTVGWLQTALYSWYLIQLVCIWFWKKFLFYLKISYFYCIYLLKVTTCKRVSRPKFFLTIFGISLKLSFNSSLGGGGGWKMLNQSLYQGTRAGRGWWINHFIS